MVEIAINQIVKDHASSIARDRVCASLKVVTTILQHSQSAQKKLIKQWP